MKRLLRPCFQIGICQAPLPAAAEPDRPGSEQRLEKGIGIGNAGVPRVHDNDILEPGFPEWSRKTIHLGGEVPFQGGGYHHQWRFRTAGQRHECLHDHRVVHTTTHDDQMAAGRPDLRR